MEDKTLIDYTGICNVCGKGFDIFDTQEDFSIHRMLGYGTKYDGDRLDLKICCSCMEKIIDMCKETPVVCTDEE